GVTIEHLIFDGGSTDDTAEVVSQFPHATFQQEPDEGMSDAINKGFSAAKGRWVMWLNTDDRLKPGALKAVLDFAEGGGGKEADVIYGGWDFIDKEGRFMRAMTIFPFDKKMLCYLGCYIGSTSAFYRNSTVISEGLHLNKNFGYIMDGEFYNRLASVGKKFSYMHTRLADFRIHGMNLSFKHKECSTVSDQLVLEKQHAESIAIRRSYGWHQVTAPPWVWFLDGALFLYYQAKKFTLKRIYRAFKPLIELPVENSAATEASVDRPSI
ncbi:glycosyltransferase, partial [Akkermansiaceae bacterium]|nr:glycosyltransferase [Akkermansiaceae bacterium]